MVKNVLEQINSMCFYYLQNLKLCDVLLCIFAAISVIFVIRYFCNKIMKPGIIVVEALYVTALLCITVLGRKPQEVENVGSVFTTYQMLFSDLTYSSYEILFNMLLFFPMGVLLKKEMSFWSAICAVHISSWAIEITQLFLKRGLFEISDIINNTFGGIIGIFFVMALKRVIERYRRCEGKK